MTEDQETIQQLKREIRNMQLSLEKKNKELDALHKDYFVETPCKTIWEYLRDKFSRR